ncbi:helix-turn-helix domain-containing protein [Rhodococcus koreensis]
MFTRAWSASVSATSTVLSTRRVAYGILGVLSEYDNFVGATVTCTDSDDRQSTIACLGYDSVLRYHHEAHFSGECSYIDLIRGHSGQALFWTDVPNFERSEEFQDVYLPRGIGGGLSIHLANADGTGSLGYLHVSFKHHTENRLLRASVESYASQLRQTIACTSNRRRAPLSRRELDVVTLVAQGMSNREIADRLFIARRTVATHLENVFQKLGVASRAAAVALCLSDCLIDVDDVLTGL